MKFREFKLNLNSKRVFPMTAKVGYPVHVIEYEAFAILAKALKKECICIPDSEFPENRICDACKVLKEVGAEK
jgi:hypothetical protein